MAEHPSHRLTPSDRRVLEPGRRAMLLALSLAGAVVGFGLAVVWSMMGDEPAGGWRRLAHAYLLSFSYFHSISLAAVVLVLLGHLWRGGWLVSLRRPLEIMAANLVLLSLFSLPIVGLALSGTDLLYPWAAGGEHAQPAHAADPEAAVILPVAEIPHPAAHAPAAAAARFDPLTDQIRHELHKTVEHKRPWLNPTLFAVRWAVYCLIWCVLGLFYWRTSVRQDTAADEELSRAMARWSAPGLILTAVTLTLASFDLLMSLEPSWFSTIFGVYYFAGGMVGAIALLIVTLNLMRGWGLMVRAVNVEHYHDLGKLLFAFVFFWGYIAFSQYMLLWYANVPETSYWFRLRGVTTVPADQNGYTWVTLVLLFGHLLLPFVMLLSRHVKRSQGALLFWALWMLVMHWADLYWLVMPQYANTILPLGPIELGCGLGMLGVYTAGAVQLAGDRSLVPEGDPRLSEALKFENI